MILLIGTDDANLFHVSRTVSRTLSIMIANDKVSISEYFKCKFAKVDSPLSPAPMTITWNLLVVGSGAIL